MPCACPACRRVQELTEQAVRLADGVAGALVVLARVINERCPVAEEIFASLERQRCTGRAVWVRYKDQCGEDFAEFCRITLGLPDGSEDA